MTIKQPVESPTALLHLLNILSDGDIAGKDLYDVLEEYAFRSLLLGKRVRHWSAELDSVLSNIHDQTPLVSLLRSSKLSILFPFSAIKLQPYFPGSPTSIPPPLIPSSTLATISRKQLVDVLAKLTHSLTIPSEDHDGWQGLVTELSLEYVGRRWRNGMEKAEEDLVGGIGRKLLEIEFDIQLRGHPETTRSLVLPVLQRVRFELGIVSLPHLIARLLSPRHQVLSGCPLVSTWLTTRLRAGIPVQGLLDELSAVYECRTEVAIRNVIPATIRSFGLHPGDWDPGEGHLGGYMSTTEFLDSTPSPGLKKRFSLKNKSFNLKPSKWRSHRRTESSASRNSLELYPASSERRPSLPNFSAVSLLHPFGVAQSRLSIISDTSTSGSSIGHAGGSETGRRTKRLSAPPDAMSSAPDLLSAVLEASDESDIRQTLIQQLLEMKYYLSPDPTDDWYLGEGRMLAQRIFRDIERSLYSFYGSDVDLQEIRNRFNLLAIEEPLTLRSTKRRRKHLQADSSTGEFGTFPRPPPRLSTASSDVRSRVTSFDLDRYFEDISEAGDEEDTPFPDSHDGPDTSASTPSVEDREREEKRGSGETIIPSTLPLHIHRRRSTGLESLLTTATGRTEVTTHSRRSSSVKRRTRKFSRFGSGSSFSIQQATRGWIESPVTIVKNPVVAPRRVRSIDVASLHEVALSMEDTSVGGVTGGTSRPIKVVEAEYESGSSDGDYRDPPKMVRGSTRLSQWSRSEADLLVPSRPSRPLDLRSDDPSSTYTRIPPFNSLRKRRPFRSALNLEQQSRALSPPGTPTLSRARKWTSEQNLAYRSSRQPDNLESYTFPPRLRSPIPLATPQGSTLTRTPEKLKASNSTDPIKPLTPPTSPRASSLIPRITLNTPRARQFGLALGLGNSPPEAVPSRDGMGQWQSMKDPTSEVDTSPEAKRWANRRYRVVGDEYLSPEKYKRSGSSPDILYPARDPLSSRSIPTNAGSASALDRRHSEDRLSPSNSSEEWYTAPSTPRPTLRSSGNLASARINHDEKSVPPENTLQQRSAGVEIPPRESSLHRLKPSASMTSLSGATTWSTRSYRSTSTVPAAPVPPLRPRPIPHNHAGDGECKPTSQERGRNHSESDAKGLLDVGPSDRSASLLKELFSLFVGPVQRMRLRDDLTDYQITQTITELLGMAADGDQRKSVKWLISQVAAIVDDPRWTRLVSPLLDSWASPSSMHFDSENGDASETDTSQDSHDLPDLTPTNVQLSTPPRNHPLLISLPSPYASSSPRSSNTPTAHSSPRSPHPDLPWSASNPELRHARHGSAVKSGSGSHSISSPPTPSKTRSGRHDGPSRAEENVEVDELDVKFSKRSRYRTSISTFGRRESMDSNPNPPTSSDYQTLYEALLRA